MQKGKRYDDTLKYFNGDELATSVWIGKYAADNEITPDDMHTRLAKQFYRIEEKYNNCETNDNLSEYGKVRNNLTEEKIYNYFKDFKYIVPQGRVMAGLGVSESYRSLSNCLRLPSPKDNYSSIMYTDTMLVSSAKRGCGYGLGISNLRPNETSVSNAAKTSTGAISFMDRFSNSTREVGQNSRRGACLIDIDIKHPDVLNFIKIKQDLKKVTGANISIFLNDDFMKSVEEDGDFILKFPINLDEKEIPNIFDLEYDILTTLGDKKYIRKIKAKNYFKEVVLAAKNFAEPGVFFRDMFTDFSPSNVYGKYFEHGTNACITGDYKILTNNGYKLLKDINETDLISTSFGKEKISNIEVNKNLPVWNVKFSDGGELDVTENHIFYGKKIGSISKQNDEIKLKDLKIGDNIKIQKVFNVIDESFNNYIYNLKRGILLGDGCYTENLVKTNNNVRIASNIADIKYNENIEKLFNITRKVQKNKNSKGISYDISNAKNLLNELNLETYETACQKNFNISSLKTVGDFIGILDGLLATDGNINTKSNHPQLRWDTCSLELARNIRLCLLAIGCQGRITESNSKGGIINGREIKRNYPKYTITISGESLHTYILKSRLYEIHPEKGLKLKNLLKQFTLSGNTWYAAVKEIKFKGIEDVYDIYCEESDTWVVNGYLNRGCGEQPMAEYDTCRLILINLFSIVKNPFTEIAEIDFKLLYEIAYEQLRLGDNLVDLEIEYLDRIINKIKSDEEPIEEKIIELTLWEKVKDMAVSGRRVGCGITALADMLAAMNLKYDSDKAIDLIDKVMKIKLQAELDCSIDLSIKRGHFDGFNKNNEFTFNENNEIIKGNNKWYDFIKDTYPEQVKRMCLYGRRNVNLNTIAPAGSVSILTQTSSGCEPLFNAYYIRRKKINPNDKQNNVDFIDLNGDKWEEYVVLHQKFKDWCINNKIDISTKETIEKAYKNSPYYKSSANEINWYKRIEIQSVLQKYTTSAISSTINLPKITTKEEVYNIYMMAWKSGLKGITIYVDGSRDGVMITEETKNNTNQNNGRVAEKRPKTLNAKVVRFNNNSEKWVSVVGLLNDKPYEIFTGLLDKLNIPLNVDDGYIIKNKENKIVLDDNGNELNKLVSRYDFQYKTKEGNLITVNGLSTTFREEFWDYAKLISGLLRHNMPIEYVVDVTASLKLGGTSINSWKNGVIRTLKKFIKDGTDVGEKCPECGEKLTRESGCISCSSCGYSKC